MVKQHITLSVEDKQYLEHLLAKGTLKVKVSKRALALLALEQGATLQAVAASLVVSYLTVLKWRNKYREQGLAFLADKPRSGRPVEIDGEQRAKITALACSQAPEGYERWSLRLLADRSVELGYCDHISYRYVGEVLKKTS
jgi:transposase